MSFPLFTAVSSLLFVAVIGGTFLYVYLRSLRDDAHEKWFEVLTFLRLRLDKIPHLIETLRTHAQGMEEFCGELISLRADLWPQSKPDHKRVHKELEVTDRLRRAWSAEREFAELRKSVDFLALKTEFREVARSVEEASERYNESVRRYNRAIGARWLKPLMASLGLKRLPIFEFEGSLRQ